MSRIGYKSSDQVAMESKLEPKLSFIAFRQFSFAITLGLLIVVCLAPALAAEDAATDPQISAPADSVFTTMTDAWRSGDEKAMSALVHPDGLRVTHGGDYDRFTIYSPDQAFYYFQDLFQSRTTKDFQFRRLKDPATEGQSLAMVEWQYLLPGRELSDEIKYVVVLTLKDQQWWLAQLNSISQR